MDALLADQQQPRADARSLAGGREEALRLVRLGSLHQVGRRSDTGVALDRRPVEGRGARLLAGFLAYRVGPVHSSLATDRDVLDRDPHHAAVGGERLVALRHEAVGSGRWHASEQRPLTTGVDAPHPEAGVHRLVRGHEADGEPAALPRRLDPGDRDRQRAGGDPVVLDLAVGCVRAGVGRRLGARLSGRETEADVGRGGAAAVGRHGGPVDRLRHVAGAGCHGHGRRPLAGIGEIAVAVPVDVSRQEAVGPRLVGRCHGQRVGAVLRARSRAVGQAILVDDPAAAADAGVIVDECRATGSRRLTVGLAIGRIGAHVQQAAAQHVPRPVGRQCRAVGIRRVAEVEGAEERIANADELLGGVREVVSRPVLGPQRRHRTVEVPDRVAESLIRRCARIPFEDLAGKLVVGSCIRGDVVGDLAAPGGEAAHADVVLPAAPVHVELFPR